MVKLKGEGVTVQCVGCKQKKLIPFARAAELNDPPVCEKCLLPMVAIEARAVQS